MASGNQSVELFLQDPTILGGLCSTRWSTPGPALCTGAGSSRSRQHKELQRS